MKKKNYIIKIKKGFDALTPRHDDDDDEELSSFFLLLKKLEINY